MNRCTWAKMANPRYLAYRDHEWGVPCRDETTLFEMLNLEGDQAGLSWETILYKREYRAAFDQWDATVVARCGADKVAELLSKFGIVRNRLKVAAAISNAPAYHKCASRTYPGRLSMGLCRRCAHRQSLV